MRAYRIDGACRNDIAMQRPFTPHEGKRSSHQRWRQGSRRAPETAMAAMHGATFRGWNPPSCVRAAPYPRRLSRPNRPETINVRLQPSRIGAPFTG